MKKMNYTFSVPDNKRVRMIVSTDCKNEADDQFALAHHLMTPMFIMKGIVPCHFSATLTCSPAITAMDTPHRLAWTRSIKYSI